MTVKTFLKKTAAAAFGIGLAMALVACDEESLKSELDIDTEEVVEEDVSEDLFINDLYARMLKFEAANETLAADLVSVGQDVNKLDDAEFVKSINDQLDAIVAIVDQDILSPGPKDGEASAASYYEEFRTNELLFIEELRKGVTNTDLDAMAAAFEHQTEAMTYFETVNKSLAIAMENKAGK